MGGGRGLETSRVSTPSRPTEATNMKEEARRISPVVTVINLLPPPTTTTHFHPSPQTKTHKWQNYPNLIISLLLHGSSERTMLSTHRGDPRHVGNNASDLCSLCAPRHDRFLSADTRSVQRFGFGSKEDPVGVCASGDP